jgi:hypothetical protein
MHHITVTALLTKFNCMLAACLCVVCDCSLAQASFVTPCQALVTVVDEPTTQKIRLESFDLNILQTGNEDLIIRVQGETHIEFFYATQPSVLITHKIHGMSADIAKAQWAFQYQQVMPRKTARINFSLNPITGAVQYSQVNQQQQTVHAHGLCELPLQGKEAFIEAHSRITTP